MKRAVFLFVFILLGCKQFYFPPNFDKNVDGRKNIFSEKLFFEVNNSIVEQNIPSDVIFKKIYLQPVFHSDSPENVNLFHYKHFYDLEMPDQKFLLLYQNLLGSLKVLIPSIKHEEKITISNKNLPRSYPLKSFDPNEIDIQKLIYFSDLKDDEVVFLPLICYYNDQFNHYYTTYTDINKLIIAFYIFDKNQIYYAKSVGLSKTNFIQNSINPKDTQFLQSEWDYLVYEALRPLLEKGVKLEIVGRE